MVKDTKALLTRRCFLRNAGATALAVGTGPACIIPGRAQPKTLKILRPKGNTPASLDFLKEYANAWGEKNDTLVTVDFIGMGDLNNQLIKEATEKNGHDLIFLNNAPRPEYEPQAIDHREILEECEKKYGKAVDLFTQYSYNPKTRKYFGFCSDYTPLVTNYRRDLWEAENGFPDTWEDIRFYGRRIKFFRNHSVGIPFAHGVDSEGAWRALLYTHGASVQNSENSPVLKSKETLEAIKFAKALYEEAMTDEVLDWDGYFSNNQFMLSGEGSLTLNVPSITRAAERKQLPIADKISLAPLPQGPMKRIGPVNSIFGYLIWDFAKNIGGAKQFLVDFMEPLKHQIQLAGFGIPLFPNLMPNLNNFFTNDPNVNPPDKYKVLINASNWSTNVGHSGYFNAAISEIYNLGLIPTMFFHAATSKMSPEEAMIQADQEVRKIYDKWRALGKV